MPEKSHRKRTLTGGRNGLTRFSDGKAKPPQETSQDFLRRSVTGSNTNKQRKRTHLAANNICRLNSKRAETFQPHSVEPKKKKRTKKEKFLVSGNRSVTERMLQQLWEKKKEKKKKKIEGN